MGLYNRGRARRSVVLGPSATGTALTRANGIAMMSLFRARPACRASRPMPVTTTWAFVLATAIGCAPETASGSARPQDKPPAPRLVLRAEGERFLFVAFRPNGRQLAAVGFVGDHPGQK